MACPVVLSKNPVTLKAPTPGSRKGKTWVLLVSHYVTNTRKVSSSPMIPNFLTDRLAKRDFLGMVQRLKLADATGPDWGRSLREGLKKRVPRAS